MPKANSPFLAFHEAGHAIVGLCFGRTLTGIALHPPGGVSYAEQDAALANALTQACPQWFCRAREDLIIAVAGVTAEALFGGRHVLRVSAVFAEGIDVGGTDLAEDCNAACAAAKALSAHRYGESATRETRLAELEQGEEEAEAILRKNEAAVRRLADALLRSEAGRLSGEEVMIIVGELS